MQLPKDILDDLCSRFLINLPESERNDLVRLCFQLELAHWFYEDFYMSSERPNCSKMSYREFARQVFAHCPFLRLRADEVDDAIEHWRRYKGAVPAYGAVLVNDTLEKVLLVQGYYAKSSWGFPKGKVNEEEPPMSCAAREVREETGFDITEMISPDDYLELQIHDSVTRLYLIHGVPTEFPFEPTTRNEIKAIQWFDLSDLPTHKGDNSKKAFGIYPNHFFTVVPFVEAIKAWAAQKYALTSGTVQQYNPRLRSQPQNYITSSSVVNKPPRMHHSTSSVYSSPQQPLIMTPSGRSLIGRTVPSSAPNVSTWQQPQHKSAFMHQNPSGNNRNLPPRLKNQQTLQEQRQLAMEQYSMESAESKRNQGTHQLRMTPPQGKMEPRRRAIQKRNIDLTPSQEIIEPVQLGVILGAPSWKNITLDWRKIMGPFDNF